MNTRKVRDPEVTPSRDERERALAAAMVKVWDSQTLSDIAAAVGWSANSAQNFADRNADPHAQKVADRMHAAFALLWRIEGARVFLQPETPGE